MKQTKKSVLIVGAVLLLLLAITATASATRPVHVEGYVPLYTYVPGAPGGTTVYGVCDPYLVGMAAQPAESPGTAVHGTFTSGNLPAPPEGVDPCPYTTEAVGTCELILIPVEEFGNPESKLGRGTVGRCTGDLQGLHATYKIYYLFTYDAWYHIDP